MERKHAVLDGTGWDSPNSPYVVSLDIKQHGKKGCCVGWDGTGWDIPNNPYVASVNVKQHEEK